MNACSVGVWGTSLISDRVHALFAKMGEEFSNGDLQAVAASYVWPVVIYVDGKILIEMDRTDSLRSITLVYEASRNKGATCVVPTVQACNGRVDERFSADVLWDYRTATGQSVAQSDVRYFCRLAAGTALEIEMIEYRKMAFPELAAEMAAPRYHH